VITADAGRTPADEGEPNATRDAATTDPGPVGP
jgi:hypothetical protein